MSPKSTRNILSSSLEPGCPNRKLSAQQQYRRTTVSPTNTLHRFGNVLYIESGSRTGLCAFALANAVRSISGNTILTRFWGAKGCTFTSGDTRAGAEIPSQLGNTQLWRGMCCSRTRPLYLRYDSMFIFPSRWAIIACSYGTPSGAARPEGGTSR